MPKIATFYDHIVDVSRQESCSVVDALKLARELGVEAVEASANNIVGREDEMGQELAMADLSISSVPSYFDFGWDFDVERQALPILEAAQYLGADRLLVIPGFFQEGDSPEEREAQLEGMVEGVNRLADLAAGYGLSLVMEEYDSEAAPFSSAAGVRYFLDRCPGLACAFDTGNFRFAGEDLLEAYDLLRDRVAHVHLKDRSFVQRNGEGPKVAMDGTPLYPCPVGGGDLPVAEVVSRLRRDGYGGIYTIEHYGASSALDYLRRSIGWVKEQLGI